MRGIREAGGEERVGRAGSGSVSYRPTYTHYRWLETLSAKASRHPATCVPFFQGSPRSVSEPQSPDRSCTYVCPFFCALPFVPSAPLASPPSTPRYVLQGAAFRVGRARGYSIEEAPIPKRSFERGRIGSASPAAILV